MTTINLTKRQYIAAQILGNLITLEDFTNEQAVKLSVELAEALLKKESEFHEASEDTIPDPAWDYATLWGLLCTCESRVKGLKQHLSQFEEGTPEINEETYHQLMGILESVNGAMKTINVRPRYKWVEDRNPPPPPAEFH